MGRVPRLSAKAGQSVDLYDEQKDKHQLKEYGELIREWTKDPANHTKCKKVWRCIEAKMFDGAQNPAVNAEPPIPPSRTELRLLSATFLKTVLVLLCPVLSIPFLNVVSKKCSEAIHNLFYFAVAQGPKDPVFTHIKSEFRKFYTKRYKQLGRRLDAIQISDRGIIDWVAHGAFKIVKRKIDGARQYFIQHLSGNEVPQHTNKNHNKTNKSI